mmetsp:Transcript_19680/g.49955  ORF Transcript_19680/g.49955 Transcript_19680/m.49955 type:complete len:224 (+) Transcript_19680:402-1073(+)
MRMCVPLLEECMISSQPRCASMMHLLMNRPRPTPFTPCVEKHGLVACGSNTAALWSAGMPRPVSTTDAITAAWSTYTLTRTLPPGGVNLSEFASRLPITWSRRCLSARQQKRGSRASSSLLSSRSATPACAARLWNFFTASCATPARFTPDWHASSHAPASSMDASSVSSRMRVPRAMASFISCTVSRCSTTSALAGCVEKWSRRTSSPVDSTCMALRTPWKR